MLAFVSNLYDWVPRTVCLGAGIILCALYAIPYGRASLAALSLVRQPEIRILPVNLWSMYDQKKRNQLGQWPRYWFSGIILLWSYLFLLVGIQDAYFGFMSNTDMIMQLFMSWFGFFCLLMIIFTLMTPYCNNIWTLSGLSFVATTMISLLILYCWELFLSFWFMNFWLSFSYRHQSIWYEFAARLFLNIDIIIYPLTWFALLRRIRRSNHWFRIQES